MTNRQIVVAKFQFGSLAPDQFRLDQAAMPAPTEGKAASRSTRICTNAVNRRRLNRLTYRFGVEAEDAA